MVDESRIGIYEYVESILTSVNENVYLMDEPQELTQSDTEDGFIVIRVGEFIDASEFNLEAYALSRVYIECFVPTASRGRIDEQKYKQFEDDINAAVTLATSDNQGTYWIQPDSFISADMGEMSNANNAYYMFVKSFIVVVDG